MGRLRAGLRGWLIEPFMITRAPVAEVAWGSAMGVLTALLPLFGVQMYVAVGLWMAARWTFGKTFSLPACFASSWVMNPLTVAPIYYVYYWTGDAVWDAVMEPTPDWTFRQFEDVFVTAISPQGGEWWERFFGGVFVLLSYFGWPIVLGSLMWSIPLSIAAYLATRWGLVRYRERAAAHKAAQDSPLEPV